MHATLGVTIARPCGTLDLLFTRSVQEFPRRPALFVSGKIWSYSEFDALCRLVETKIRAAGSPSRQANIGLIYSRDSFSYAAIIAILRSGNVYVPLNSAAPHRVATITEDAGIETIVVDTKDIDPRGLVEFLRRSRPLQVILQGHDSLESLGLNEPALMRRHRFSHVTDSPEDLRQPNEATESRLAYILYTSGSTGTPKGVAITHASACSVTEKFQQLFQTSENDRFSQFSVLSFDTSIMELFVCWRSGGTLYVPDPSEALVPLGFAVLHEITVWSSVPSLASFLLKLRLLNPGVLKSVRVTIFGGDALPAELARTWSLAAPASRVFNLYGPTEVTVTSTYYEYKPSSDPDPGLVPIGVPMAGLSCMVMDDGQEITSEGVLGELWISGDQLACGYWGNRAATHAAFVRFPTGDPAALRWYRTGDVVSWHEGVGFHFRGRLDRQVKLLGNRIELQEVEAVLRSVVGCTLAAAVAVRNASGVCERIVAYCDRLNADESTVKANCLAHMPRYMVPERIYELESFPLSDHGKIDYLQLTARAAAQ
jgi:D-alanine--poly(phosphoribitol) ligase subunit 1